MEKAECMKQDLFADNGELSAGLSRAFYILASTDGEEGTRTALSSSFQKVAEAFSSLGDSAESEQARNVLLLQELVLIGLTYSRFTSGFDQVTDKCWELGVLYSSNYSDSANVIQETLCASQGLLGSMPLAHGVAEALISALNDAVGSKYDTRSAIKKLEAELPHVPRILSSSLPLFVTLPWVLELGVPYSLQMLLLALSIPSRLELSTSASQALVLSVCRIGVFTYNVLSNARQKTVNILAFQRKVVPIVPESLITAVVLAIGGAHRSNGVDSTSILPLITLRKAFTRAVITFPLEITPLLSIINEISPVSQLSPLIFKILSTLPAFSGVVIRSNPVPFISRESGRLDRPAQVLPASPHVEGPCFVLGDDFRLSCGESCFSAAFVAQCDAFSVLRGIVVDGNLPTVVSKGAQSYQMASASTEQRAEAFSLFARVFASIPDVCSENSNSQAVCPSAAGTSPTFLARSCFDMLSSFFEARVPDEQIVSVVDSLCDLYARYPDVIPTSVNGNPNASPSHCPFAALVPTGWVSPSSIVTASVMARIVAIVQKALTPMPAVFDALVPSVAKLTLSCVPEQLGLLLSCTDDVRVVRAGAVLLDALQQPQLNRFSAQKVACSIFSAIISAFLGLNPTASQGMVSMTPFIAVAQSPGADFGIPSRAYASSSTELPVDLFTAAAQLFSAAANLLPECVPPHVAEFLLKSIDYIVSYSPLTTSSGVIRAGVLHSCLEPFFVLLRKSLCILSNADIDRPGTTTVFLNAWDVGVRLCHADYASPLVRLSGLALISAVVRHIQSAQEVQFLKNQLKCFTDDVDTIFRTIVTVSLGALASPPSLSLDTAVEYTSRLSSEDLPAEHPEVLKDSFSGIPSDIGPAVALEAAADLIASGLYTPTAEIRGPLLRYVIPLALQRELTDDVTAVSAFSLASALRLASLMDIDPQESPESLLIDHWLSDVDYCLYQRILISVPPQHATTLKALLEYQGNCMHDPPTDSALRELDAFLTASQVTSARDLLPLLFSNGKISTDSVLRIRGLSLAIRVVAEHMAGTVEKLVSGNRLFIPDRRTWAATIALGALLGYCIGPVSFVERAAQIAVSAGPDPDFSAAVELVEKCIQSSDQRSRFSGISLSPDAVSLEQSLKDGQWSSRGAVSLNSLLDRLCKLPTDQFEQGRRDLAEQIRTIPTQVQCLGESLQKLIRLLPHWPFTQASCGVFVSSVLALTAIVEKIDFLNIGEFISELCSLWTVSCTTTSCGVAVRSSVAAFLQAAASRFGSVGPIASKYIGFTLGVKSMQEQTCAARALAALLVLDSSSPRAAELFSTALPVLRSHLAVVPSVPQLYSKPSGGPSPLMELLMSLLSLLTQAALSMDSLPVSASVTVEAVQPTLSKLLGQTAISVNEISLWTAVLRLLGSLAPYADSKSASIIATFSTGSLRRVAATASAAHVSDVLLHPSVDNVTPEGDEMWLRHISGRCGQDFTAGRTPSRTDTMALDRALSGDSFSRTKSAFLVQPVTGQEGVSASERSCLVAFALAELMEASLFVIHRLMIPSGSLPVFSCSERAGLSQDPLKTLIPVAALCRDSINPSFASVLPSSRAASLCLRLGYTTQQSLGALAHLNHMVTGGYGRPAVDVDGNVLHETRLVREQLEVIDAVLSALKAVKGASAMAEIGPDSVNILISSLEASKDAL